MCSRMPLIPEINSNSSAFNEVNTHSNNNRFCDFNTYSLEGVTLWTYCRHYKLLQQPAGGNHGFHCYRRRTSEFRGQTEKISLSSIQIIVWVLNAGGSFSLEALLLLFWDVFIFNILFYFWLSFISFNTWGFLFAQQSCSKHSETQQNIYNNHKGFWFSTLLREVRVCW